MSCFLKWALIVVSSVIVILFVVITSVLFSIWIFPSILIELGVDWTTKNFPLLGNLDTFARVGSGFGIISALTTIVAVALLWQTYNLQKSELKEMVKNLSEQKIWNHVLQMCKFYKDMIEKSSYSGELSHGKPDDPNKVVNNPKPMAEDGLRMLILERVDRVKFPIVDTGIEEKMNAFLKDIEKAFSPYDGAFRMLYRIFKYIDDDDYDKKDSLSRIPRSMLSNIELEAIFINSLTSRGDNMRYYVEKYGILDNYKVEALSEEMVKYLRQRYDASAFRSQ